MRVCSDVRGVLRACRRCKHTAAFLRPVEAGWGRLDGKRTADGSTHSQRSLTHSSCLFCCAACSKQRVLLLEYRPDTARMKQHDREYSKLSTESEYYM